MLKAPSSSIAYTWALHGFSYRMALAPGRHYDPTWSLREKSNLPKKPPPKRTPTARIVSTGPLLVPVCLGRLQLPLKSHMISELPLPLPVCVYNTPFLCG